MPKAKVNKVKGVSGASTSDSKKIVAIVQEKIATLDTSGFQAFYASLVRTLSEKNKILLENILQDSDEEMKRTVLILILSKDISLIQIYFYYKSCFRA